MALTGCATGPPAVVDAPRVQVEQGARAVPCPYTTFATQSDLFPDWPLLEETVTRQTYENLERRYAKALRRVGWREVRPDDHPAFYLGLTLAAPDIDHVVLGTKVRELKASIGRDAYHYALKRAPFLARHFPFPPPHRPSGRSYREHACLLGARCLGDALQGAPRGLTKRLALRLPARWAQALDVPTDAGTEARDTSVLLIKKVIEEVLPEWSPLLV